MAEHDLAVLTEGLRKTYGRTKALDGLDMAVPRGTVHGVLGPNGAGKTTLVRTLATLLRVEEGRARVAGIDLAARPGQVRRRIGLLGQHAAVDEELSGRQNLEMFGRLHHLGGRRAAARAAELLERFGLADTGRKPVSAYSGGMRRRLDLAASLIVDPDVLFLDEPTTGLDPRGRGEVWSAVRSLGLESTMTAITRDLERGVVDRFRSMPMAPSAVLVGRGVADMLESVLSLVIVLGAGLAIGWRWHGSLAAALGAVGLLLLLRFALLWCGIWLGLIVGRPELVMAVQILVWPLAFTSGAFASPESMPGWLGAVAEWNPMSASATAVRDLFGNPGAAGTSWAAENALLLAVLWPLALLALACPMAAARFRGLGR